MIDEWLKAAIKNETPNGSKVDKIYIVPSGAPIKVRVHGKGTISTSTYKAYCQTVGDVSLISVDKEEVSQLRTDQWGVYTMRSPSVICSYSTEGSWSHITLYVCSDTADIKGESIDKIVIGEEAVALRYLATLSRQEREEFCKIGVAFAEKKKRRECVAQVTARAKELGATQDCINRVMSIVGPEEFLEAITWAHQIINRGFSQAKLDMVEAIIAGSSHFKHTTLNSILDSLYVPPINPADKRTRSGYLVALSKMRS